MKVFLERINNDYLFEVENKNGHKVLLDNNSKTSGKVQGASPMELLLMGVAGCSAIDIISILEKQKINPLSLKMEVDGLRNSRDVPSLFYQIDIIIYLKGEIEKEKALRAAKLSYDKYCSVSKILEKTAKINYKVVLNDKNI
jgi:putative redox protein